MYLYKEVLQGIRRVAPALFSVIVLLFLFGCQSDALFSPDQKIEADNITNGSELAIARRATANYQNIKFAMAAGYQNIHYFVPGMGDHYVNSALVDDLFEIDKPEALVYDSLRSGARPRLVAVEYLVATPGPQAGGIPPEGFTGEMDEWEWNDVGNFWTLHAWVWLHNKDGVFAELNPALLP